MKKLLLAAICAPALVSCGPSSIPIPPQLGGGTLEGRTVYHDFRSPDNSPTNPNAVLGRFVTRKAPGPVPLSGK